MANPKYPTRSRDKIIPVPCGKCHPCKMRRANSWVFRLLQQEKIEESAHFITLTYAPEFIRMTENNYMTIDKRDIQLFFKRLRKLHTKEYGKHHRIKYYLCGEYGSKTFRPHYHAIVFNMDTDLLDKAWNLGSIHYGSVTGNSISYTLKYMAKASRIPLHPKDDRVPEFSLMSKKLGANYITDATRTYHSADISRNYVTMDGGIKVAMPRYYRDKIFTEEQRLRQQQIIAKQQLKKEKKHYQSFVKKYGDDLDFFAWKNHARKTARLATAFENAQKTRNTL